MDGDVSDDESDSESGNGSGGTSDTDSDKGDEMKRMAEVLVQRLLGEPGGKPPKHLSKRQKRAEQKKADNHSKVLVSGRLHPLDKRLTMSSGIGEESVPYKVGL